MASSAYLRETWPLFVFMRILGWLPARRRHDSDKLDLNVPYTFYSVVVISLQLGPAAFFVYKGITHLSSMDPKLRLASSMQLCGIGICSLIPLAAALQTRSFVVLANQLHDLQAGLSASSPSSWPQPLVLRVRGVARATLGTFAAMFACVMVLRPVLLGVPVQGTYDLLISFGLGNMALLLGWWATAMRAIRRCAETLRAHFNLLREYNEDGRAHVQLGHVVLGSRSLWLQLLEVVRSAGDALAVAKQLLMLVSFTLLMFSLYSLLGPQHLSTTLLLLAFALFSFMVLFAICMWAHVVTLEVRRGLMDSIATTKYLRISSEHRNELLRFLIHLANISPEVTFSDYITVGRGLVSQIVAGLIAMLLMLYQLKITNRQLEVKDFFTFGDRNDSL